MLDIEYSLDFFLPFMVDLLYYIFLLDAVCFLGLCLNELFFGTGSKNSGEDGQSHQEDQVGGSESDDGDDDGDDDDDGDTNSSGSM